MMKKTIIIILIIFIFIGLASYFYSCTENREFIQSIYRDLTKFEFFLDYRERHLYLYTNRYMFKDCEGLNNTECRNYLSTYGWKLYKVDGSRVRFNYTWLDETINEIVDVFHSIEYGFKIMIADFGHYTKINFYKAEVLSKRGLDPIYFPEPYKLSSKLFELKLDYDMKNLIDSPSVIILIYYNAITLAIKGYLSGVWLLFYFLLDETMIQLIICSFLANFLVFLIKEFAFLGVNKLSGGTIKFWMFQKYTSLLQEIGLLDCFNNAMSILVMVRVIMIMIGLPYLFNIGALYSLIIVLIYCFWYLISHVQHKIKYEVELKIKADIGLKKATKVEFSFYTFMERVGIWFLQSFWVMVPFTLRLYRQGFDFRPFKDLIAPNKYIFTLALVTIPVIVPIFLVIDIIIHTFAWTVCYLWLYPYVFNRRISETKWLEILKAIGDRSVVINSEELLEKDDYLYNLIRSWLLILGFYRFNGENIKIKGKISLFLGDIKDSYPTNNMHVWAKIYEMPIRYLKGKFLHSKPKNKEKYELFLNGLEMDAYRLYGTKDIRLIWTAGSKDPNKLNTVKSVIDAIFIKKFGKRWVPTMPEPVYERPDIDPPEGYEDPGRYKGYFKHILLNFEMMEFDQGFINMVVGNYNSVKMSGAAIKAVEQGEEPSVEGLRYYDAVYLICYTRYHAACFYEEDLVDIPVIGNISNNYYIEGVKERELCKTVCLLNSIMSGVNIVNEIRQSILTGQIVKTKHLQINHFIKDAYERLSLYYNEELNVELEQEEFEVGDYKKVLLKEYIDYTVESHKDLAEKFSKTTGVSGSILTQLGHLREQVRSKELNQLYDIYNHQLNELKLYDVYPVYMTGSIQSDISLDDHFITLLMNALSKNTEIYNEFRLWMSNFKQEQFSMVLAWFVQNNTKFLYRYIPREQLNYLIIKSGLDKYKAWFQPDTLFELKKKEFFGFIDKIRHITDPLIVKDLKDDDYIELEDFIEDKFSGFDYGNMSRLSYKTYEREVTTGFKTVGIQRDYTMDEIQMVINKEMVSNVRHFAPSANLAEYVIANPNRDLVFSALEKYKRRKFNFDLGATYQGYHFMDWLFSLLDNMYKVDKGFKAVVRDIDSFSIEDLSKQSRRASPGFLATRNGVKNKADKLDMTKGWAKAYRKSILADDPFEHIWMTIVVPKTCKPGAEEVRVVNAPEMYYYINQYLIFETFIKLSKYSKVTNDFCLFFGDFDTAVRKHTPGYQLESLDLRHQGGRIQREIKEIFKEWYGRFMPTTADNRVFKYLLDDIFSCKFMIPANYGGFIFQKEDGWCDGPYGTNQFDSWAMVVYYFMNVWTNIVSTNSDITMVKPTSFIIESHGDNWLHSYPPNMEKLLTWKPATLNDLGQEVKGTISQSKSPLGLELMGFTIHLRDGLYVGTRPFGKTIKSLVFNHKKYANKEQQKSYEKSIIGCLKLVDCWNQESYTLLNQLDAIYASVVPKLITIDAQYKHFILEKVDMQPRIAWTHESKRIFSVDEADPTNIDLWVD